MSAAIGLRLDFGAAELRTLAGRTKNASQARRLLALAAVYDGKPRAGGMDRQTLRDWAHRFNQLGPESLIDRKAPGGKRELSAAQQEELKRLVEAGPDLGRDGVARWRCVDLKRELSRRFGVDLSEVSLGRQLKQLGFSRISARPLHQAQDPEKITAF